MIIIVFCLKLKERIDFCLLKETQLKKCIWESEKNCSEGKSYSHGWILNTPVSIINFIFRFFSSTAFYPSRGDDFDSNSFIELSHDSWTAFETALESRY